MNPARHLPPHAVHDDDLVKDFIRMGSEIMDLSPPLLNTLAPTTSVAFEDKWSSHFQIEPTVCAVVWRMIEGAEFDGNSRLRLRDVPKPEHLLWALVFLKVYSNESVHAGMCGGVDVDTFRKWSLGMVEMISYLQCDVIRWENRLIDDVGNDCLCHVDGVDCLVATKYNKAFYSQKFNKAALRYEVAAAIRTANIVWICGPLPPGDWNDLMIFRKGLKKMLRNGERVEADDGYAAEDPLVVKARNGARYMEDTHWAAKRAKVGLRHETINQRIKQFNVLTHRFHHDLSVHSSCFRACVVLTQLSFQHGTRRPFSVDNYDQSWTRPERAPLPPPPDDDDDDDSSWEVDHIAGGEEDSSSSEDIPQWTA